MKRQAFTFTELLCVISLLLCIAALLFPVFAGRMVPVRNNCQTNLRQIAFAIKAYAQDADERLPLVYGNGVRHSERYGWAGAVRINLRGIRVLRCTLDTTRRQIDTACSGFSSYWYNSRLDSAREKNLASVSTTIALGDGSDGNDLADAAYNKGSLPVGWIIDHHKPSFRHAEGANYAFVDGHVKWLKPAAITDDPVRTGNFTFSAH